MQDGEVIGSLELIVPGGDEGVRIADETRQAAPETNGFVTRRELEALESRLTARMDFIISRLDRIIEALAGR